MGTPDGPRAELEAAVWEAVREMQGCRVPGKCEFCNARVDGILAAADAYGRAEYGISAERRAVLAQAGRVPGRDGRRT